MILPKAEPSQPRTLPAEAVTGTGGVFVSQTGQMDIDSVDAFTGDVELTASAAIADAEAGQGRQCRRDRRKRDLGRWHNRRRER
jgi:hypothetical protein